MLSLGIDEVPPITVIPFLLLISFWNVLLMSLFLALTLVTQTLQNWFCHLCFCQQLLEFSPWSHTLCSQAEEALLLKTGPEVHSHWHTQCCQHLFLLNSSCISSSSSWKMIVVLFFIFGQKKLPLGLYIFYLRNSGGTESKPTLGICGLSGFG